LASVILLSGSGENPNERAGSLEGIHVQARVLYIESVQPQQVCFKLTTGTIEALKKHYRDLCRDSLESHSRGDVMIEANVKSLVDNFERAIEHFLYRVDTVCLDDMEEVGSGELTTQRAADIESTILKTFAPYGRYLSTFPGLLRARLSRALFETASFGLQHPRLSSEICGSDAQVSAGITTSRQPTRS
jgi:hypothetical protein